jgi:hypothetical protein
MNTNSGPRDKVEELRQLVFAEIKKCLEEDGHCKSYEGRVELIYPNYFEDQDTYLLELHCYLIGPTRRYEWRGKSFDECAEKAIADVKLWTTEEWKDAS